MFHDLIRNSADNVYRDGKSHARMGVARVEEGGIDANELAAEIDQGSSCISRIDRGIGLNEIFDLPNSSLVPVQSANDPGGHRLTDVKRAADRDDEIADLELI